MMTPDQSPMLLAVYLSKLTSRASSERRCQSALLSSIALIVSSALPSSRLCRLQPYAAWMGWRRMFLAIPALTCVNARHN